MLSTSNLTIQFTEKPLFENISVKFSRGHCYGLIGANGSGKSTFMKILSGAIKPTFGNVSTDQNERISTLIQDQFAFDEYSLIETVIMGHRLLWDIKMERERIYGLAEMSEADGMKVADLEAEFAELDGYSAESNAGELLLSADIQIADHHKKMAEVDSGLKLRVLLLQALFSNPDIILLDEPTNNLDIRTIGWLETMINKNKQASTIIVISHDRHFLNQICDHTVDLDYGTIKVYPGNYDEYMLASTQAQELMAKNNQKKKAELKQLQAFVSRFSANASKARQATSRAKQIDKIVLEDMGVSSRVNPYIKFDQSVKIYRFALEIKKLFKEFNGIALFKSLSLGIKVGEKVAIIGQNGVGKTTLLKCLMGEIAPDDGSIKFSENANIGYFPQDYSEHFIKKITVFEWMEQYRNKTEDEQHIRGVLGKLLFKKKDGDKLVSQISGGEKGRMLFGKLMQLSPNIMLLDEPTNHLDMESIESLNLALQNYPGTVIFVSHDREFVSSLATRIVEIKPTEVIDYVGTYDEYIKRYA